MFEDNNTPQKQPGCNLQPRDEEAGRAEPHPLDSTPVRPSLRPVNLTPIDMSLLPEVKAVELLEIQQLKGPGAVFTPNAAQALQFHGLAYRPDGGFNTSFQILSGDLPRDPRIANQVRLICFVPAYSWSASRVVLMPLNVSTSGARVVQSLNSLESRFPLFKVFVDWNTAQMRHIVYEIDMSDREREFIAAVRWPLRETVDEVLQQIAYDDIRALAAANSTVQRLINSRVVE